MKSQILLSLFCLLLCACSNDDDNNASESQESPGFFALKIGNEWNYEYFSRQGDTENFVTTEVFVNQQVTSMETLDGLAIYTVKLTTSGNDGNFGIYPDNGETFIQVKDSLGYLVQVDTGIVFSSDVTDDYLISSQNFGDVFGRLLLETENITTGNESFETMINERFSILTSGESSLGRDRFHYAEGVGLVLERIGFVNDPDHFFEKRLISFDINN